MSDFRCKSGVHPCLVWGVLSNSTLKRIHFPFIFFRMKYPSCKASIWNFHKIFFSYWKSCLKKSDFRRKSGDHSCLVWGILANSPRKRNPFPFTIFKMKHPSCETSIWNSHKIFFSHWKSCYKKSDFRRKSGDARWPLPKGGYQPWLVPTLVGTHHLIYNKCLQTL